MLKYLLILFSVSSIAFAQDAKPMPPLVPSDTIFVPKTDSLNIQADSLNTEVKYDTLSYAEEYKRDYWRTFFGGRFGLNQSKFRIDENFVDRQGANGLPILDEQGNIVKNAFVNNPGLSTGFHAGLFFRFVRGSFYFQPEMNYTLKAGKFDILNKDLSLYKRVNGAIGGIDMPLLIGIRSKKTRVFFGPTANFAFRMNKNLKRSLSEFLESETLNNQFFNRPIMNFQVGFGYELKGFFIDFKYEKGLKSYTVQKIGPISSPQSFNLQADGFFISIGVLGN
jgi:Outer membrane protein beta-barrel domain